MCRALAQTITERRIRQDFAHNMKLLVDDLHTEAKAIRVVLVNLGAHKLASRYETYPPEEAQRIANKFGVTLHAQALFN